MQSSSILNKAKRGLILSLIIDMGFTYIFTLKNILAAGKTIKAGHPLSASKHLIKLALLAKKSISLNPIDSA
jgi:hypothetical protein